MHNPQFWAGLGIGLAVGILATAIYGAKAITGLKNFMLAVESRIVAAVNGAGTKAETVTKKI